MENPITDWTKQGRLKLTDFFLGELAKNKKRPPRNFNQHNKDLLQRLEWVLKKSAKFLEKNRAYILNGSVERKF